MEFSEKDLEDIIFDASQNFETRGDLVDRGLDLPLYGKMYRQVNFGTYGIADLINVWIESTILDNGFVSRLLNIEIIELKKDTIGNKALNQACRYLKAIRVLWDGLDNTHFDDILPHITLIGSNIDNSNESSFVFLYNELENWVDIYSYKYKYDGIWFEKESHSWQKSNPTFTTELKNLLLNPGVSELKQCVTIKHYKK
jgi:hypothetical protein